MIKNDNCVLGEILINGELVRSDVYLENGCTVLYLHSTREYYILQHCKLGIPHKIHDMAFTSIRTLSYVYRNRSELIERGILTECELFESIPCHKVSASILYEYINHDTSEAAIAARGGIEIYDSKAVQDSINKISSFLDDVKTQDIEPDSEMYTQFENLLGTMNSINQTINRTHKRNNCEDEVDC